MGLRRAVEKHVEGSAWGWANERVGSIHTFQGREVGAVEQHNLSVRDSMQWAVAPKRAPRSS